MSGQDERAKQTPVSSPPRATGEELTGGSAASIAQIRRRWARVTPGRWTATPVDSGSIRRRGKHDYWIDPVVPVALEHNDDAYAIANAPHDIATLLAAVDASEAREAALANVIEHASRLAWDLTGVVAEHQNICAAYPDDPIPVGLEDQAWHIYASAVPLQDALDKAGIVWREPEAVSAPVRDEEGEA